jgi:hypothetical protein
MKTKRIKATKTMTPLIGCPGAEGLRKKMNTQWIKTADRAPTEKDYPIWLWATSAVGRREACIVHSLTCSAYTGVENTHWRPAKDDIPEPPKEKTQWEKDRTAWQSWYNAPGCNVATVTAWHAALAYEREQVAKMLPEHNCTSWSTFQYAIEAICARCEGRGQ